MERPHFVDRLRPEPFGNPVVVNADLIAKVEADLGLRLPATLKLLLVSVGDAVLFGVDVRFKAGEFCPLADAKGRLELTSLYGIPLNDNGLVCLNNELRGNLPKGLVAIGHASGGNQVCLDRRSSKVILWDHESPSSMAGTYEIADSLDEFWTKLEA